MSLVILVRVNDDEPHAILIIQRSEGTTEPDSINTYEYRAYQESWLRARGHVQHRYGAGSLSLLATVCRHAGLEQDLAQVPRQDITGEGKAD